MGLFSLEVGSVKYALGFYNQVNPATQECLYHYRVSAKRDGEDIVIEDFSDIQRFLSRQHPRITFIQVYPAKIDTVDEGHTYHFFGYSPFSVDLKQLIDATTRQTALHLHCEGPLRFGDIQNGKTALGHPDKAAFSYVSTPKANLRTLLRPTHIFIPPSDIALPNLCEIREVSTHK